MQSMRSACLFFHLKLPKMLRCQRIPPQTFLEAAQRAQPHDAGFRSSARVGRSI